MKIFNDSQFINELNKILDSSRDKDFFKRIWSTDLLFYENRLKAINFSDLNYVLDAGSGFGQWSIALSNLNKKVLGVEFSKVRVSASKFIAEYLKCYNVQFQIGNIQALNCQDNTFDGIFSYSAIYFTDFKKTFKEFYRLLKRGGLLYFNTNDLGWYIFNLIEKHNPSIDFSPRQMAIDTMQNSINYYSIGKYECGKCLVMPQEYILNELMGIGFEIIGYGADGSINLINDLEIESFYEETKYNLTNVYEVLCYK